MECINNNVKVLIDNKEKNKINFFKKNFIRLNFKNLTEVSKLKVMKSKNY